MCLVTEYFVTSAFDERRFRLLLDTHNSKMSGTPIHIELVEVSISAMLECVDKKLAPLDVFEMQKNLYKMDIMYKDLRKFSSKPVIGDVVYAVKEFNKLCNFLYN